MYESVFSHLADTFVVKETQSVTKDSGVVPVMSSHWAGDVPPVWGTRYQVNSAHIFITGCE